jgi:PAS domain S-box-containing protein
VRDKEQTEENMREYARIIGADEEGVVEAFREVPSMNRQQFEKVARALHTLANQLSTLAFQNVQQARFITDRKIAEKALRESEYKFRGMAENIVDVLFLTDTFGIINYISPSCVSLFKLKEDQMTAKPFMNFLAEDQIVAAFAEFKKMLETGEKVLNLPLKIVNSLGEIVPVELSASTFLIEGRPIGAIGTIRDVTDRLKAEEELRKFKTISDKANYGTVISSIEGEMIYMNDHYAQMYGYEKEELIGKNYSTLHSEGLTKEVTLLMDIIKRKSSLSNVEFSNIRKDGSSFFTLNNATLIRDEKGKPLYVASTAIDITEKKESELELIKLSQAIEQSPVSILITDLDGRIEYVNPQFSKVTGYNIEEAIGENPRILKSGIQSEDIYKNMWETISRGETWHGELLNHKKNGETFWESASMAPIFDSMGRITKYIAIKEDITQRKTLEETLKLQNHFRELLVRISSGFINIPFDKVDEAVNTALRHMALFVNADRAYTFDYDWEREVCDNMYEWCGPGISAEIDNLQGVPLHMMQEWVEAHQKGEPMYVPDVSKLPYGGPRDLLEPQGVKSVLAVPMLKEQACIGFVGFDSVRQHHNYSDTEMQLLKIFAELLTNVKLRREMVEQLVLARKKAEESDLLKTHFLNNVNHEIRTPLNGIVGFSDFLIDDDISVDDKLKYIKKINSSSDRLTKTIDDILLLSELRAGSKKLNLSDFAIVPELKMLEHSLKDLCASKNILISLDLPASADPIIRCDQELFRNLLWQLLTNAEKFTAHGRISFGFTENNNEFLLFVKDTGRGIARDKLEDIFLPFMQEDISSTRGHEGGGLGLTIAREITGLFGGRIWPESEPGKGSTFWISLPKQSSSRPVIHDEKKEAKTGLHQHAVILIADDDENSFMVLHEFLRKSGHKTLRARDGGEAVSLCREYPEIGLVLMDIKMPGTNGVEAMTQIKEFRHGLPIIAITAFARTGDRQRMLEAGFEDYAAKPIGKNDVARLLSKHL